MSLTNRAMLVSLSISQWSARKLDKRETEEVARRHGTATEVARVNKSLLPFAGPLDAIHKKTGEIRNMFYSMSLPWRHGVQIIKADAYMPFVTTMRREIATWRQLVDTFVQQYPQLREDAKLLLNGLYREEDYPDPSRIAGMFAIDVAFSPVPDAEDWRVSLGDDEIERLRSEITDQVQAASGHAMREAWRRIYEVVERTHERLKHPDNIFRDSLVENAADLCRVLPGLNITDDPNLESMRQRLEGSLCVRTPEQLRTDLTARQQVADEMADILAKMGAFYRQEAA